MLSLDIPPTGMEYHNGMGVVLAYIVIGRVYGPVEERLHFPRLAGLPSISPGDVPGLLLVSTCLCPDHTQRTNEEPDTRLTAKPFSTASSKQSKPPTDEDPSVEESNTPTDEQPSVEHPSVEQSEEKQSEEKSTQRSELEESNTPTHEQPSLENSKTPTEDSVEESDTPTQNSAEDSNTPTEDSVEEAKTPTEESVEESKTKTTALAVQSNTNPSDPLHVIVIPDAHSKDSKEIVLQEIKTFIDSIQSDTLYAPVILSTMHKKNIWFRGDHLKISHKTTAEEGTHYFLKLLQKAEQEYQSSGAYTITIQIQEIGKLDPNNPQAFERATEAAKQGLKGPQPQIKEMIQRLASRKNEFYFVSDTPTGIKENAFLEGESTNPSRVEKYPIDSKTTNYVSFESNRPLTEGQDREEENGVVRISLNPNMTPNRRFRVVFDKNNEVVYLEKGYSFFKFKTKTLDRKHNTKIATLDLETYPLYPQGPLQVRAAGGHANGKTHLYNLCDYKDSGKMIIQMIYDIFTTGDHVNTFYAHNFGNFDILFLLKPLSEEGFEIKTALKEGQNTFLYLTLKKKFRQNCRYREKKLTIYDSYSLMPSSLKDLCRHFQTDVVKGVFPHSFITPETLNYVGKVPSQDHFVGITDEEYNQLCSQGDYSVKDHSDAYLTQDLISLHECLLKFSTIIYQDFTLNITKSKTLSALALRVYLSNFYKKEYNVGTIIDGLETEIRYAYYGGLVRIPEKAMVENAYAYDVNSMYPSMMANMPMPVGTPMLSLDPELSRYFGFCYCKITPPKDLKNHLIPIKDPDDETFPSKTFEGLYCSELLKKAKANGYIIEVLGGLKFLKKDIFSEYVKTLHTKKVEAQNAGNPSLVLAYKFLLNSLYGRMGMKTIESKTDIIPKSELENLKSLKKTLEIDLGKNVLVRYAPFDMGEIQKEDQLNLQKDLIKIEMNPETNELQYFRSGTEKNVSISAFITSYANMFLGDYMNLPDNTLYYSDTDSLVLAQPLPAHVVHPTELGRFKLEHKIAKGWFVRPKLYGFQNDQGKDIIKASGHHGKINLSMIEKAYLGIPQTVTTTTIRKDIAKLTLSNHQSKRKL